MNGIVKEYDKQRGFGFITGDDGEDYFACTRTRTKTKSSGLRPASELRLM